MLQWLHGEQQQQEMDKSIVCCCKLGVHIITCQSKSGSKTVVENRKQQQQIRSVQGS